jgi:hypothetical protein
MAQLAFGARATARTAAKCTITSKHSGRTFICTAHLSAGRWTLTTQAKAGAPVIAQVVKRVTVKRMPSLAVTG